MSRLESRGRIRRWRLLRRKMGLGSGPVTTSSSRSRWGLAQLDSAFAALAQGDDEDGRRHSLLHQMIGRVEIGLYRSYPDPTQGERIAVS